MRAVVLAAAGAEAAAAVLAAGGGGRSAEAKRPRSAQLAKCRTEQAQEVNLEITALEGVKAHFLGDI